VAVSATGRASCDPARRAGCCPGECGRCRPVAQISEIDRAAGEPGIVTEIITENDRAARKSSSFEPNQCAGEISENKGHYTAGELGIAEINRATGEVGTGKGNRTAGEIREAEAN
jgi:hypothetical protein